MKYFVATTISLLAATAEAYPQGLLPSIIDELTTLTPGLIQQLTLLGQDVSSALNSNSGTQTNPPFDASKQIIDVSGIHEWKAPGPNDARGPCPGLNALANHGYLPRDGFGTIFDFIDATTEVFGMGIDLAAILSAYGAIFDGIGIGWSVGGKFHTGISGSHGHYETDNSPMRADLHQYGSDTELVVEQFQELWDLQSDPATANYDIGVLSQFRKTRYHESIAKNPWFYYGPFSGTTVSAAAFTFIYRFMANHTIDNPEGILGQDVLKSFFSVSGSSGNFKWTPGNERIPDNWYRRSLSDPYGLGGLGTDASTLANVEPAISQPGCNQGKVNSFTPINSFVDSSNAYDFSKPEDGVCYAIAQTGELVLSKLPVVNELVELILLPVQNSLNCVTVPAENASVAEVCPGYSFYGGPAGEVAPGAIQN